jgi:hypothetical protein
MSNKSNPTVATMGIDIGKNSFHVGQAPVTSPSNAAYRPRGDGSSVQRTSKTNFPNLPTSGSPTVFHVRIVAGKSSAEGKTEPIKL